MKPDGMDFGNASRASSASIARGGLAPERR
jgi:hypothetical protein